VYKNKHMKKILVLTIIFACAVSVSMAQKKAVTEAIDYAEKFDFSDESMHDYCYIVIEKGLNVLKVDGVDRSRKDINGDDPIIVAPGIHTLDLSTVIERRYYYTSLRIIVESGECYIIVVVDGITDNQEAHYEAYFESLTDAEMLVQAQSNLEKYNEKRRDFLQFQKQNPIHLDGTWSGEKKRALNTFFMRYIIKENRIAFGGESKHARMRPFVAEGRLFYSENIVILMPEKAYNNGKEVENFSEQPKYIWYYTKTDDELFLEGGRLFDNKGLIWENTGIFHRVID